MANPLVLLNDNIEFPPPQAYEGTVHEAPAGLDDDAKVIVPDIDPESLSEPCNWRPEVRKDGLYFPKKNDKCLVVFPETGDPWIVQFWVSAKEPDQKWSVE